MHGRRYESLVVEKYEDLTNTKTRECGLFVSAQNPMLGASPDRIVNDKLLVEVKCPYVARNREISSSTVPYLKFINDELVLDVNHSYYYQIQGQLYCAEREYCDLVVYTFKDIKVIRILRDDNFIENMIEKLIDFYNNHFKDTIVEKYLFRDYNRHTFY